MPLNMSFFASILQVQSFNFEEFWRITQTHTAPHSAAWLFYCEQAQDDEAYASAGRRSRLTLSASSRTETSTLVGQFTQKFEAQAHYLICAS